MAAELGLLSLTPLQKLAQYQQHQSLPPSSSSSSSWMWNTNQVAQEDDDSWEVRAFEQDTGNINGTTWPPRSYTCTFCRREFRSAQALGGHMNVHRRDRARLHQAHPGINSPISSNFPSSTMLIPAPEFVTSNGGLCLIYSLANPNGVQTPTTLNSCMDSPSKPLSISPCPNNNLISPFPPSSTNYPATPHSLNSSICHSGTTEPSASNTIHIDNCGNKKDSAMEELDLELRLGRPVAIGSTTQAKKNNA